MLTLALTLVLSSAPVGPVTTVPGDPGEWSAFRGANGSGIAGAGAVPEKLDPEGNLLWRAEVPAGYSSPIISRGRLFVTAAEDKQLLTLCLDAGSGEVLWRREVEFDGSRVGANSSASPTPASDGERVFCLFHHLGMVAYDFEGEELWRNPLGAPYEIPHGMSSSPVVHGDRVVVQIDQDSDSRLVALDKTTGELAWEAARPGVTHGYSTPIIHVPESGEAQVITSGALQVVAYSLASGKKVWWFGGTAWQVKAMPVLHGDRCIVNAFMVPTSEFGAPPITQSWEEALADKDADGDGMIGKEEWPLQILQSAWFIFDLDGDEKLDERDYLYLVNAGKATGGLYSIRTDGEGDVTGSHLAWRYDKRRGMSDLITPVLVGDTLFVLRDGGILTAIDAATGDAGKQERIGDSDQYYASPVAAGGRILTASKSGNLSVIAAAGAEGEWEVLSTVDLEEDVWSTPALANGQVYVRSQKAVYCFAAEEG